MSTETTYDNIINFTAQATRDEMARVLADLLIHDLQETSGGGSEDYRAGIRDSLEALIRNGANKPD